MRPLSKFVHNNGHVNLEALAAAPTQMHVVFVNWIDLTEVLQARVEAEVKSPVHFSKYTGSSRPEADVYALVSPEDLLTALGRHSQVLRAVVERRDGKRV